MTDKIVGVVAVVDNDDPGELFADRPFVLSAPKAWYRPRLERWDSFPIAPVGAYGLPLWWGGKPVQEAYLRAVLIGASGFDTEGRESMFLFPTLDEVLWTAELLVKRGRALRVARLGDTPFGFKEIP